MDFIAHVREDGEHQSLQEHLLGVGDKAGSYSAKIGLASQGELIGLLHDLGKYGSNFQAYIKSATGLLNQDEDEEYVDAAGLRGTIDHSSAGAQFLWRELSKQKPLGPVVGQMLALCIASHHSGLIDCLSADSRRFGEDDFSRRMGKADVRTHLTEAWEKLDAPVRERVRQLLSEPGLIAGIGEKLRCIVAKSNGQTDKGFVAQQQIGLLVRCLFSCLIDADRLDTAIFEKPKANRHRPQGEYVDWKTLSGRLEAYLASLPSCSPIDGLRRDIARHCLEGARRDRGIFTLSVPTGGGKTLASLRFALNHADEHRLDRIVYVIPFTSIIDQNAKVVREILEPKGSHAEDGRIVLEHHSNLTPEVQGWRDKILTENWDAPVIYTTMAQFLETLFGAGTRGARRMHQMANAVVVFDEIQSLPVKCVHLFSNALQFLVDHCGSTAVLCTATQPLLGKVDPLQGSLRLAKENELMPDVGQLFDDLKRVEIVDSRKSGGYGEDEVAYLAVKQMSETGSCLTIVNTKAAARSLYQHCTSRFGGFIAHLSTSMCPAHRKQVLADIVRRLDGEEKEPVLCVSTQLIEAGVDVDFGSVIRYMAGLDSIAQAAGRCNRHGHRLMGQVHVVNPSEQNLSRLPDIAIGIAKAERILDDYRSDPARFDHNLIGPKAMNWYYENYFYARRDDMCYPVSADALGHDDSLLNLLSTNTIASEEYGRRHGQLPPIYLRQSFMAAAKAFKAIDAPTRGVIVPFGDAGRELIADLCAAHEVEKQHELLRRAQQFTVNVFAWELEKLQQVSAVYPVQEGTRVLHLDPRYYSTEFGLAIDPVNLMEALIP